MNNTVGISENRGFSFWSKHLTISERDHKILMAMMQNLTDFLEQANQSGGDVKVFVNWGVDRTIE